jgi:hypothetical protein
MRSYQVFAAMPPERSIDVLRKLSEKAPQFYKQALVAASASLKARPVYLQRQPFDKQAQAVRRALARVAANAFAEEALAVYFLECRKDLLVEWLDALGIEHEDGILKQDSPPAPSAAQLAHAHDAFRAADDDPDRALLLKAFAAQSAIDWPELEALLSA